MKGDITVTRVKQRDEDEYRKVDIREDEIAAVAQSSRASYAVPAQVLECSQIVMRSGVTFAVEESRDDIEGMRGTAKAESQLPDGMNFCTSEEAARIEGNLANSSFMGEKDGFYSTSNGGIGE